MKYGAHCYIFTDRWSDDQLYLLDVACELGLVCFEIGVGDDVSFTPLLTRRHAEMLGLELNISPGGLWPRQYELSAADPQQRRHGLAWHCKQVDLASELGARAYTGALYGHPGVLHHRPLTSAEYEITAAGLRDLAEYGQHHGVRIVIEPMSHFRTHVANTAEQAMHLLALADHPNLSVLLDTYHLITEVRDYANEILICKDRLWGIHACENDRGVPGGGLVPWPSIFGTLNDIDFDGYLIFESYNSAIDDFAYQRGMMHNVCPDGKAFIQAGLSFLRSSQ